MSILDQEGDVKQEKIVSMFDDIAPTYDTANRVMSMGVDISWRKKACDLAFDYYGVKEIDKIVDVACGTGDMMGYWQKQADKAVQLYLNLLVLIPLTVWSMSLEKNFQILSIISQKQLRFLLKTVWQICSVSLMA